MADLLSFSKEVRRKVNPITIDCPPNDVLTARVRKFYAQVVPESFELRQLPPDIKSFVYVALQTLGRSWTRNWRKRSSKGNATSEGGPVSQPSWDSKIPSSVRYPNTSKSCWPEPLLHCIGPITLTDQVKLRRSVRNLWWHWLCRMPSAVWVRRFGNVTGTTPSTSREEESLPAQCIPESNPS